MPATPDSVTPLGNTEAGRKSLRTLNRLLVRMPGRKTSISLRAQGFALFEDVPMPRIIEIIGLSKSTRRQ
jgi:hypothetical protein